MGGYDNKSSIEFTNQRKQAGRMNRMRSAALYNRYINHPTAQFEVSFLEYKKLGKRKREQMFPDGGAKVSTRQS